MSIALSLLRAEALASRIEGILLADPHLAGLWRMEVGLVEAAASVGLEGERISPSGMVTRLVHGTALAEDSRSSEMGRRLLSAIKRPGDVFRDPVATLRRIELAAAPVGRVRDEGDVLGDEELILVVEAGREWTDLPIMAGWRAAAAYASRSRRDSPVAERLIFMAVEARARGGMEVSRSKKGSPSQGGRTGHDPLVLPVDASWILAPSTALTRTGFRIWAPLSGLQAFLNAAVSSLSHDLGHMGALRHELSRLDQLADAARGRSRIAELVDYLKMQPVLNSAMVIEHLGVTRKTALALIGSLEDAGCLVNLTARRAARFWTLPSLAARMSPAGAGTSTSSSLRGSLRDVAPHSAEQVPLPTFDAAAGRLKDGFDSDRLDRIMADLDVALAELDSTVRSLSFSGKKDG